MLKRLKDEMFGKLEATNGMFIPINPDRGGSNNLRNPQGSPVADFPPEFLGEPTR